MEAKEERRAPQDPRILSLRDRVILSSFNAVGGSVIAGFSFYVSTLLDHPTWFYGVVMGVGITGSLGMVFSLCQIVRLEIQRTGVDVNQH